MRYNWIKEHKTMWPIKLMCEVLNVSTSGFYDFRGRKISPRAMRRDQIRRDVQQIHEENHNSYGSWKIADAMAQRDDMESACRNTVASAMRELGLKSRVFKKFKPTTTQVDPSKRPAENVLQQNFHADRPNQKWVTDITYIDTDTGWVYLAAVMDCFSRKVVGWSISHSLATVLVSDALRGAIESRQPDIANNELLHHSDRGCQYTSDAYQKTLKTLGIKCSMSRTGCCYDNAAMERFFWSLKQEWTNHETYTDLAHARQSIFHYIEIFYNRQRSHQALGYMTPEKYETRYEQTKIVHPRKHAPETNVA